MSISTLEIPAKDILGSALFPMPLVPMERFMLWDDTPRYPKAFRVSMCFEGRVDEDLLLDSLRLALANHPMLCASLISDKSGTLLWYLPERVQIQVANEGSFQRSPFNEPINLYQGNGFRAWYSVNSDGLELVIDVHHAVSDGLGGRALVRDWLRIYHDLSTLGGAENIRESNLDPSRLLDRGRFVRNPPSSSVLSPSVRSTSSWEKLVHAWHFHVLGPHRIPTEEPLLVPSTEPRADPSTGLAMRTPPILDKGIEYRSLRLSSEQSSRLMQVLADAGWSFNEFLVGTTLHAIYRWNSEHQAGQARRRVRILIPTNHRTKYDLKTPATNRIGFGFVSARQSNLVTLADAMKQSALQSRMIQELQLGLDFVDAFSLASKLEWPTKLILSMRRSLASAVVTNLGDLAKLAKRLIKYEDGRVYVGDNLEMTGIFGVPPIRQGTPIGIGACRVGDRLCIATQIDSLPGFTDVYFDLFELALEQGSDWLRSSSR